MSKETKELINKIKTMVDEKEELSGFFMMFMEKGDNSKFETISKNNGKVISMFLNLIYSYTTNKNNGLEWNNSEKDENKDVVKLNSEMAEGFNDFCQGVLTGDKETQESVKNVMRNVEKIAHSVISTIDNYAKQTKESEE